MKDYGFLETNSYISSSSSTAANQNSTKKGESNNEFASCSNDNINEALHNTSVQVDQTEKNIPTGNRAVHLKREIGLWGAVSILVGMIIGKILEQMLLVSQ